MSPAATAIAIAVGARLIGAGDANCCPSRIRERRIHWTGTRTTVRIRLP